MPALMVGPTGRQALGGLEDRVLSGHCKSETKSRPGLWRRAWYSTCLTTVPCVNSAALSCLFMGTRHSAYIRACSSDGGRMAQPNTLPPFNREWSVGRTGLGH